MWAAEFSDCQGPFRLTSRTTIDSASVIRRFTTLSRTDSNTGLSCSLAMPVQATWPVLQIANIKFEIAQTGSRKPESFRGRKLYRILGKDQGLGKRRLGSIMRYHGCEILIRYVLQACAVTGAGFLSLSGNDSGREHDNQTNERRFLHNVYPLLLFLLMSAYARKVRGIRKPATNGQDIKPGSIDCFPMHPEITIEI